MNNIYRAQFALAPSFDANAFMTIIKNWLDGIENCPIKFDYDMSLPEYHFTDEKGGASLLVCNYQDTPALLLESIIPDRYSLTVTADLSQMSMRVDCTYDEADEHAVIAPVPDFVKLLAWNGYMRQEHGLTPATPMYVTSLNANEFANVLLKQANISSPLIYISASQTTGRLPVDANLLASDLMGIASVAADVSPMSTAAVKTALQSSDRISIKDSSALIVRPWHDSDGDHVEFSQLYGIAGLYEMLLKTLSGFVPETPDDNLNFEKIRYKRLISRLTEHDLEYSKLCEDMIGEKDREIARLSSELSELKAKYAGISSKADAFEDKLNKNQVSDKGLMFESSENDLYPDERKDVILKLLEKERDAMKDDATLSRSRKFDVISDVLAHNFPSGTDERIICAVRDAFSGGRLTKADIGRLCEAGVIVAKEGRSAHYRCTMDGEDRYCVTLSATPSDSRSGRNAVSEFANLFFGY